MLHSGEEDQVFFERAQTLQMDNMYLDWNSNTSKYYIRGTLVYGEIGLVDFWWMPDWIHPQQWIQTVDQKVRQ